MFQCLGGVHVVVVVVMVMVVVMVVVVLVVVVVVMVDRAIYMHWGLIGEVFMSSMDLVVC